MSKYIELPQLEIRKPCRENWDAMSGAEQSRHCGICEKSVFNLSEMTRSEVQEILCLGESVCVRMQKRNDGSIVTKNPKRGLFGKASAVVISMVASLTLAGCTRDATPTNTSPPSVADQAVVPAAMGEAVAVMGDVMVLPEDDANIEEERPVIMGQVNQTQVEGAE